MENPALVARHSWKRKSKIFVLVFAVTLLLAGFGIYYWRSSVSIIDRKLASQADFTVYAPRQEPKGYKLQQEQTSLENDLLTYKFTGSDEKLDIIVTVQDRPDGFNMNQISEGGSINATAMDSGTLYNLSTGETGQYLLDTGISLVYITSPSGIDTTTINSLANSLRKIN